MQKSPIIHLFLLMLMMMLLQDAANAKVKIAYPDLESAPKTLEQAQFYNVLIRITRCSTLYTDNCMMDVYTSQDFIYYLQKCAWLQKWHINYSPPSQQGITLSLTGNPKRCLITVMDEDSKPLQRCMLFNADLKKIVNLPALNNFLEHFDNSQKTTPYGPPILKSLNTCMTMH